MAKVQATRSRQPADGKMRDEYEMPGASRLTHAFERLALPMESRQAIEARYGEPHRAYHTIRHIENMLAALPAEHQLVREMLAATLYHDIIYDPQRNDNEERSADLFEEDAKALWPDGDLDVSLVIEMILATKGHHFRREEGQRSSAINHVLRADLGILWTDDVALYRWYAAGIRSEYAFVPPDRFGEARARTLVGLRDDLICSGQLSSQEIGNLSRNLATECGDLEA